MAPSVLQQTPAAEGATVKTNGVEPSVHIPTAGADPDDIEIPDTLYGSKRKLRVGFIGAGLSALNFFKFAEEKLENVEWVSYEKNHDIGGTVREYS